jgi:hypothetical protein
MRAAAPGRSRVRCGRPVRSRRRRGVLEPSIGRAGARSVGVPDRAFWAGGPPSSVRREAASFVAEDCACGPGRQRVQRSCHQAWLGSGRCRRCRLRRPRDHFDPFLGAPQSVEFGAPSVRQRTIRAAPVLGPRLHHQLADGYMHFDRARGSSGVCGTVHFATCSQGMIPPGPAPDLPDRCAISAFPDTTPIRRSACRAAAFGRATERAPHWSAGNAPTAGYLTGPTSRHIVPVMPVPAPILEIRRGGQKPVSMQLTWGRSEVVWYGSAREPAPGRRAGAGHIRWCSAERAIPGLGHLLLASSDQHHPRRGAVKGGRSSGAAHP